MSRMLVLRKEALPYLPPIGAYEFYTFSSEALPLTGPKGFVGGIGVPAGDTSVDEFPV